MYTTCVLVLKARHLGGFAFCNFHRLEVPEQALGGIPPGFGVVMKDKPSEFSCNLGREVSLTLNQSLVQLIINKR